MLAQLSDATGGESWPLVGLLVRGALVVLLMVAVLWLWRRSQPPVPSDQLHVVAQRRLSAAHTLYLVRVGARTLLLGASPGGLSTLAEVSPPQEGATEAGTEPAMPPLPASHRDAWSPPVSGGPSEC
jgi:flagellar biogenesis protein FliO